jgi:predicted signal transduction protein with EAL and GGDEF domain
MIGRAHIFGRRVVGLYRLRIDDPDLLRAQFDAFVRQIPLLYFVLSCNAAAVAFSFRDLGPALITNIFPALLCALCAYRGLWWWRRKQAHFSLEQIRYYIMTVSRLAVIMASFFMLWGLTLYPYGDAYARGHLTFFLALTTIASICCLMPLPSAALGVATVSLVPFVSYFVLSDGGKMRVEAVNFAMVGSTARFWRWCNRAAICICARVKRKNSQMKIAALPLPMPCPACPIGARCWPVSTRSMRAAC